MWRVREPHHENDSFLRWWLIEPTPAELLTITGRRRFDPMSISRCSDFRTRPAGGAIEVGSWTPYCYDAATGRVALVQCPGDVDLAAAPFYYQAQYRHARQLRLVDAEKFATLGAAHAPQFTTPVMIYSTGRAGTTLVSKMFARLPSCVSLSEPDFHTSALEATATPATSLLRAAAQLYFQPRAHQRATHLVLKFRGMCIELAEPIRAAHPHVVDFFLYRDAEAYVLSSMRVFSYFRSPLWAIRWLHGLRVTRPLLSQALAANYAVMCRFFPLTAPYTPRELARLGPVGLLTLGWLSMMHRAQQVGLASLRYENLLRDPRWALQLLLERCRLPPHDVDRALAALEEDSQRGSTVARERASRYRLSRADRAIIHAVLARHAVIDRADFELPHAIA